MCIRFIDNSDGFLMSFFPNIENMISFFYEFFSFFVYLINEWARGIYPMYIFLFKCLKIGRSCPMSRDYEETPVRDIFKIAFKNNSFSFKHSYHKSIVNNLMIHKDRWWKFFDNFHEHSDSPIYSSTIPPWKCGINGWFLYNFGHFIFIHFLLGNGHLLHSVLLPDSSSHLPFFSKSQMLESDSYPPGHHYRKQLLVILYTVTGRDNLLW